MRRAVCAASPKNPASWATTRVEATGLTASDRYPDRRFEEVEPDLRTSWNHARGTSTMSWEEARGAAKDAFDRTMLLREERLRVSNTLVQAGDVKREEVIFDTEVKPRARLKGRGA